MPLCLINLKGLGKMAKSIEMKLNKLNATFDEWCDQIEKELQFPIDRYSYISHYEKGLESDIVTKEINKSYE